ncbi:MAG: hypothetical protein COA38_03115 [Fluviicola sp.]|nr:MAG: hypothetical protein COA38_03115 [Fluviicola sp.]
MKTIIILGALVISTGSFAQGRSEVIKAEKEIGNAQTEIRQQSVKVQQDVKVKVEQAKEQVSTISRKDNGKKDEAKEKSNNGNAFGKDKQGMTGKEFGQHRATEAKLKAKQAKTKADADAIIRMSKEDTKETISTIDTKMVAARMKLTEKLSSKEITQAKFDEKIKELMDFEKRKNSIIEEMK